MNLRHTLATTGLVTIAAAASFYAGRNFPFETPADQKRPTAIKAASATGKSADAPPKPEGAKQIVTASAHDPSAQDIQSKLLEKLTALSKSGMIVQEGALSELHHALAAWMAASPDEVVKFLSTSPQRDDLLRLAVTGWAKSDPAAASAWLAAHADTPGRDAMAAGLAVAVSKEDPNAGIQWVSSIKDPAQKLLSAGSLGWEFYRRSDEEAAEALGRMGLPESAAGPLTQTWAAKLTAVAKRNAQNLVSTANAALAAGGTLDTSDLDSVVGSISTGINGGGKFAGSVFRVSTGDWTDREKQTALKNVKVADGKVKFEEVKP
ncbi:MAG TPA: hypothetical protein VHM91_00280 [Verrucomicrobiales bacterium]|nr:hypothetical protein [Verrucomicrobiales bacterium]